MKAASTDIEQLYLQSIQQPEEFWAEQARRLAWIKPWSNVKSTRFHSPVSIEWFQGGELNACFNCVDRHAQTHPSRIAYIWQPEDPSKPAVNLTYSELQKEVSLMANALKSLGVKKGDRVTIYLPMILEAPIAILACARIGAVHSVVFGGFAPDAIKDRIEDGQSHVVITADEGIRGGKKIHLKAQVDEALKKTDLVEKVLVIRHTHSEVPWIEGRDVDYQALKNTLSSECPCEPMDAEAPLFMLYTSGSTNKPKGVLHTTAGYLLYAAVTHEQVFHYQPTDIYWCAADVGWVTGHSYIVYGPLANGATSLLYEGLPTFPTPARIWQLVDQHQVNILYTAPTLIRSLMAHGNQYVDETSRASLRILGSVGEPINPEAWRWYFEKAGSSRCPIVDTYWQTETGGVMISPRLNDGRPQKPGAASQPFWGVQPVILNDKGEELQGEAQGLLCFKDSWPGQMRTVFGDHQRFEQTYFTPYPGYYFTGDGARRDADGDIWILGRVDDVINVSGHRIGTAEVESALVAHPHVAEAAAVGYPHDIKGQGLYCYVTLMTGVEPTEHLASELKGWVRKEMGAFAQPDLVQFAPSLPKTRSGKIMRRILRKIAENQLDTLGDLSTLADPQVVQDLIDHRLNR